VLIDEYDTSFTATLEAWVREAKQSGSQSEISGYKNFFSALTTAIGQAIATCFITGVAPIALTEFSSGFNIAVDITTDPRFEGLYGFTEADVRRGLASVQPTLPQDFIDCIQESITILVF
jgi:Predicted AAA-ATPase